MKDIKQIISERLEIPLEKLVDDAPLTSFSLDSLDVADLMLSIEEEYKIQLSDEVTLDINVGQFVNYVNEAYRTKYYILELKDK